MRNVLNSNLCPTGHIDRYLGSSWDVVHAVYSRLGTLEALAELIDQGDLATLADMADELKELSQLLKDFNNIYYGPLPTTPVSRPDGTVSQDGDMYFDTTSESLFIRVAGIWSSVLGAVRPRSSPQAVAPELMAQSSQPFVEIGGLKHWSGVAPPTAYAHEEGEVVWNRNPSAGTVIGWVCVVSGTPGTWKSFGQINF